MRDHGEIERPVGDGHDEFKALAVIVHRGRPPDEPARTGEPLARELLAGLCGQRLPSGVDFIERAAAQQTPKRARVMMLDVGIEQSERRKEPRRRRHDDAADPERFGHAAGEQGAIAAEREDRELAGIAAPLGGDGLDGADHVRRGDQMSAVSRVLEREPQRFRHFVAQRAA